MKRKMKKIREREVERPTNMDSAQDVWMEEEMNMDIDEDAPGTLHVEPPASSRPSGITHGSEPDPQASVSADRFALQYETALNAAILYGQSLSSDYQSDPRPELQRLFKNTFGIVAWEDPLEAGAPIADLVGHESRVALAHELNQAILSRCSFECFSGLKCLCPSKESQGRPAQPPLETVYRHTAVCLTQLGLLGVGAAAFADMHREFLQS